MGAGVVRATPCPALQEGQCGPRWEAEWESAFHGCGRAAEVLRAASQVGKDTLADFCSAVADAGELSCDAYRDSAGSPGRVGVAAVDLDGLPTSSDGQPLLTPQNIAAANAGMLPVWSPNGGTFVTVKGNVAVFAGRWQYEVVLGTAGVQQFGFCTACVEWTREEGVGDFLNSYAYDGSRVRRWNVMSHDYGVQWEEGDVIGCCLDLDKGVVSWYHNGRSLGAAFARIDTATNCPDSADTLAFYPALSVSQGESCAVNFGAIPFRYPVMGFSPLQLGGAELDRSGGQLAAGVRVAVRVTRRGLISEQALVGVCAQLLRRVFSIVTEHAELLPDSLGAYPLPLAAFVHRVWLPLVSELAEEGELSHLVEAVAAALDEETECALWRCTFSVLTWLSSTSLHVELPGMPLLLPADQPPPPLPQQPARPCYAYLRKGPPDAATPSACGEHRASAPEHTVPEEPKWAASPVLGIVKSLCGVRRAAERWLQSPSLDAELALLLAQKNPCPCALRQLFPDVWWGGAGAVVDRVRDSEPFSAAKLKQRIDRVALHYSEQCDGQRYAAIRLLMACDGGEKRVGAFVDACVAQLRRPRQPYGAVITSAVTTKAFFLYLQHLRVNGVLDAAPQDVFPFSDVLRDQDGDEEVQRFGGVLSHLKKEVPELGPLVRSIDQKHPSVEPEDGCESRATHFQRLMLTYYYAVRDRVTKAGQGIAAKNKAADRFAALVQEHGDWPPDASRVVAELGQHVRKSAWEHVQLFSRRDEAELFSLCSLIVRVLDLFHGTPLFAFLPTHMLEAALDIIHSLRREAADFTRMLDGAPHVARFLVTHLHDPCIVLPDARDGIVSAVAALLDGEPRRSRIAAALDDVDRQQHWFEALFRCFQDKQAWVSAVLVANRLAQGLEFSLADVAAGAQTDSIETLQGIQWALVTEDAVAVEEGRVPSTPAPAADSAGIASTMFFCRSFRRHVSQHGTELPPQRPQEDAALSDSVHDFLREVFNHAGWANSELAQCLSEQQRPPSAPGARAVPQFEVAQRRRKCSIVHDLSRKLLQVLEFVTIAGPQLFCPPAKSGPPTPFEQRQRTNLRMLVEVVVHTLRRYTQGPGVKEFEQIRAFRLRGLHRVSRYRLLAPVAGIVVNLLWGWNSEQPLPPTPPEGGPPPVDPECPLLRHLVETQEEWSPAMFVTLAEIDWETKLQEGMQAQPVGQRSVVKAGYLRSRHLREAFEAAHERWSGRQAAGAEAAGAGAGADDDDDEDMCPICVSVKNDAKFKPCGHVSCNDCVQRHLLNSNKCFFCNAAIESVAQL
eukprot:TRINITY_DN8165_c0_g3_i1.p1 TRINITY_DN8165_c0_g3~~TRINITY_DN8165_c0_g3_i1.p1  ORF type:complete len:1324 (+),score=428.78 TRINITY_DN8165_c0_g3_i1:88-3972(+)